MRMMKIGLTKAMRVRKTRPVNDPMNPAPEPKKFYVIRFFDEGFDAVAAGPFETRSAAVEKAKDLRSEMRIAKRENPGDSRYEVTFQVESNQSMPFDPEEGL
jgi:hypothetical protein